LIQLADDDVCAGTFKLDGPILAHSLRNFDVGTITAQKFCFAVFGLCPQPDVTPFTVPFPKPTPKNPKKFVSKGAKPFEVIHFSDVHIDRQYTVSTYSSVQRNTLIFEKVGADANCTKNICCRNFADETGPVTSPAQPFGNSHCDSPPVLADSMLSAFTQVAPSAKFHIFTGDVVEGATWLVDQE